ncbi:Kinase-like protein [Melia azedarach]|uniref:Kinase-like protein n=1 Tax=Melia azedarach TaxID=155640 RepID=A0ACC1YLR7_MELAZ|nr:Kinase-like protein [Melia azedarach]
MENYILVKAIGSGSYGDVWQAIDKQSGELVAIKKLKKKYISLNESRNLIEVQCLRAMHHPNIVKLKNLVKVDDNVYLVFEYMECSLDQLIKLRKQWKQLFTEDEVKAYSFQILQGLHHMHGKRYFHRDLKPANFLVSKDVIKIADLGMAKKIDSGLPYTQYVTTRWYRAPEVLLRSGVYGPEVDMWAVGAIMAEMMILYPLFPGKSSANQIGKICTIIGSPTEDSWGDGIRLAQNLNWSFPQIIGINLSALIPRASGEAISLISWLCSWNPSNRPTAAEALRHPFFQSFYNYVPPALPNYYVESNFIPPVSVLTRRRVELEQQDSTCTCLKWELKRRNYQNQNNYDNAINPTAVKRERASMSTVNPSLPYTENFMWPVFTGKRVDLERQDSTCTCLKCELKRSNVQNQNQNTHDNAINLTAMIRARANMSTVDQNNFMLPVSTRRRV